MIPKITYVEAYPEYQLYVRFKGKGSRLLDMKPFLKKGIFKELCDEKYFKKVRLVWGGVGWPRQQDLSAETIYYRGSPVRSPNKLRTFLKRKRRQH